MKPYVFYGTKSRDAYEGGMLSYGCRHMFSANPLVHFLFHGPNFTLSTKVYFSYSMR